MDYSVLTVKKLQEMSKKEGLSTKGKKQDLIDGLEKLQKPAIELIVANLPMDAIVPESASAADSPTSPPSLAVDTPIAPAAEEDVVAPIAAAALPPPAAAAAPASAAENVSSQAAGPVLRTSSRVLRPRICTMCVGCHHHPTHAAGRATRKAAAPVDEASIVDLAQKFSTVNIVPEQQPQEGDESAGVVEAAAKPPVRSVRTRTARAPLKSKSNEATAEEATDAKSAKAAKAKPTTTKKKVASLKERAAAATETGKENLPTGIDEAKVTTDRPGRKIRWDKQVTA